MSGSSVTSRSVESPADAPTADRAGAPGSGVVVLGGGSAPHPGVVAHLGRPSLVIAADRGWDHARALGLRVDLLVGDLDSLSDGAVDTARAEGTRVVRLDRDKDATDLEVALDLAIAADESAGGVTFVGGTGGDERLDHLAAQLPLLASPAYRSVALRALIGTALLVPVHGPSRTEVVGRPGEYVTLLPVGGDAVGVHTEGLRFALSGETLDPFRTRGVSNELVGATATVSIRAGALLVIRPHAVTSPHLVD